MSPVIVQGYLKLGRMRETAYLPEHWQCVKRYEELLARLVVWEAERRG